LANKVVDNLSVKITTSVFWNFYGNIITLFVEFLIGIYLARELGPSKFGLIGIVSIFTAFVEIFINSGLSHALIRKGYCSEEEYSTVFFVNVTLSIFFYVLLFLLSNQIANYFNEIELSFYIKIIGLGLIINSLSLIHRTKNIIELNFKTNTISQIISSIVGSIATMALVILDFGIWSLILKNLIRDSVNTILLIVMSKWIPILKFHYSVFTSLIRFSIFLLGSGLLGILSEKIYYFIVAKKYDERNLGYYARAETFIVLIVNNIFAIFSNVGFSVLSKLKNDRGNFENYFKLYFNSVFIIMLYIYVLLYIISEELIIILLTSNWIYTATLLKLFAISGVFVTWYSLNLNVLNIYGKSNIYFYSQLSSQILSILLLIIFQNKGLEYILVGLIIKNIINALVCSYLVRNLTFYSLINQLFLVIYYSLIISFVGYITIKFCNEISDIYEILISKILMFSVLFSVLFLILRDKYFLYLIKKTTNFRFK